MPHCNNSMTGCDLARPSRAEVFGRASDEEATMRVGQIVRARPASRLAQHWQLPPEAVGTVVCAYSVVTRNLRAAERLDVRFAPNVIVWGKPADVFEPIDEPAKTTPDATDASKIS